jgi:hypothetical protein
MKTLTISLPDDVYNALHKACSSSCRRPEEVAAKIVVQSYNYDDCRGEILRLREDIATLAEITLVLSKTATHETAHRWVDKQLREHR